MSKQVSISEEQFESLQEVLQKVDTLIADVISGAPNNFRTALDLAKDLTVLKKKHGISAKS